MATDENPDAHRWKCADEGLTIPTEAPSKDNPSPAAMAILAKLTEAAKAGIKAKQNEKRQ